MVPERWKEVKDMLWIVLELEPAARPAYLDEVSAQDPELRRELESLLASHDDASTNFLNEPAIRAAPSPVDQREAIGRRLGPYQIVCQIGVGGMGEVYRAFRADDQYRKEVAIKIVRAGQGLGPILSRFKNERQILANLEHPNICRMLDGGTTQEGLPYFVMELIAGEPIDKYCEAQNLSVDERLSLFVQVCSAVEYAHQHLIVHRDIKPMNILVTKEGDPKLLDFGIAKILDPGATEESAATLTLFQVLTPGYASPEQIKGDPITTASDVYSLGVVLYELLAGQSPYQVASRTFHQISRAVCEDEPLRPSMAARQKNAEGEKEGEERTPKRLHGDLDSIVLMALRKEPQRRYASVEQFSGDIRRHLQNLPVTARYDTLRYRAGKFVIRHKAGVLAAVAVCLALLTGLAVALHEAHIARQQKELAQEQRARAERRFNDVRKLANSLMFEVHDSIKDLPGSTPARKLLVSRALEYLDSLGKEAKNDASLQMELAAAYERIGDVQGQPRQANLGDPVGASDSYKRALAIRESLASADTADLEVRRQVVPNYAKLSDLSWSMGDRAAAMEYSGKAFNVAEALYRGDSANLANRLLFARYRMDHGYKQSVVGGDRAAGLENLGQGSGMLEQMASEDPGNLRIRRLLGLSYSRTAEILQDKPEERPQALTLYKKAIAAKRALVAAEPTNAEFQRLVAYDQFAMAEVLANMNDNHAALAQDRMALAEFQKLAAADPANAQFQQDIGRVHADIGQVLTNLGKPSRGFEEFRLSLAALEKSPDSRSPQTLGGFAVITDELWLGKAYVRLASSGKATKQQTADLCRQAESWFSKCLPGFQVLRDHAPLQYGGANRVHEIETETLRCQQLLRSANLRSH